MENNRDDESKGGRGIEKEIIEGKIVNQQLKNTLPESC